MTSLTDTMTIERHPSASGGLRVASLRYMPLVLAMVAAAITGGALIAIGVTLAG